MSSDQASDETEATRSRIDALEAHVGAGNGRIRDRISGLHSRVADYEDASSEAEKASAVEEMESELSDIRDAVEEDLEEGKSKANELIDGIEAKLSKLR